MDSQLNTKKTKFYLIGLICFVAAICIYLRKENGKTSISSKELCHLQNLKLSANPQIKKIEGRGARWWIEFKVDSIPQQFQIQLYTLECTDYKEVLTDFLKDTVATFSILSKDSLQIGYATEKDYLQVYGLLKRNKEYIDLSCYNNITRNYDLIGIFFCILLSIISFYLGYRKYKLVLFGSELGPGAIFLFLIVAVAITCSYLT